jgi:ankyrin repeat protein
MLFRSARLPLAALAAAAIVAPAAAQNFSASYKFLEAVRKADGNEVTKILGEPGASIINTKDVGTGESALHIVAARGDSTYLRFLLAKGANPNIADDRGNTPLMAAVMRNFAEGVSILIEARADVNRANAGRETPLIRAVQLRNLEIARALLDAGADPDQTDAVAGKSARDYAAADTRSPALAKLLAAAPKVKRRAVSGPTLR